MKILLLGGPKFLGRHIIDAALTAGHQITTFNRGQTNPDLYPEIDKLVGDRDGNLEALLGKSWDAVIDTCGYFPRLVRASAELLAGAAGQYIFISSLSAYASFETIGTDETSPLATMEDETIEEITGETYGPLKVLCEEAVEAAFPGKALQVRAGLIVGPHDPTDRFTYWPMRLARDGDVLAPGSPDSFVQFIDVRDLAAWTILAVEQKLTGPYNITGPGEPLSMRSFLEACREISGRNASLHWLPGSFLAAQEVQPWTELPLWVPEEDLESAGFSTFNCTKAIRSGLRFRPLNETIKATLDWASKRPADWTWRAGIPADREAAVLQAWQEGQP